MKQTYRAVALVLGCFAACVVVAVPVTAAPQGQDGGGGFTRLLSFVPAPTTPRELVDIWINYGDPGAVKRLHGYSYADGGAIPPFIRDDLTDPTPEQHRARRWNWDMGAMDMPSAANRRYPREWLEGFGYDGYGIARALGTGQPPTDYGVVEFATDTASIAQKLGMLGYEQEAAPHGFGGTLYRKFGDGEQSREDGVGGRALAGMNRVVLGPGLLVAGRATALVSDALAAHTGAVPSAMNVAEIAQVVGAVDDPSLLPGTTVISTSLFGLGWAPLGGLNPIDALVNARSPEEARRAAEQAMQAADAMPLLPPYILYAMAYHRGTDQAERYQTFTLLYPNEEVARAAGAALTARIAAHRNARDGKPMLGEDVVEQLDPVVRSGEGGATVTARLRLSPNHDNLFYQRLFRRDLAFLAPGGS